MINWKLRFQNKTTLVSLILAIIGFVYMVLDAIGIIPAIPQEVVTKIAMAGIEIVCILGIVVDAGFDETGVAKFAILEPAADFGALEQVFVLTSYAAE